MLKQCFPSTHFSNAYARGRYQQHTENKLISAVFKSIDSFFSLLHFDLCHPFSLCFCLIQQSIEEVIQRLKSFWGKKQIPKRSHTGKKIASQIFLPCANAKGNDIEIFQATLNGLMGISINAFSAGSFLSLFCRFIPYYFNLQHVFAFRFGHSCNELNAIVQ